MWFPTWRLVEMNKSCISFQIAGHLVQRGVAAGAVDSQGATPLHYAACNHNLAFCRFLWGMHIICEKDEPFTLSLKGLYANKEATFFANLTRVQGGGINCSFNIFFFLLLLPFQRDSRVVNWEHGILWCSFDFCKFSGKLFYDMFEFQRVVSVLNKLELVICFTNNLAFYGLIRIAHLCHLWT